MRMTLNDFPNTYNQMYCMEIYLTTHIPSGKKYIGKDVNSNPNYFGSGKLLKEIIKSEGKTNLVKKTLEVCNNKKHLAERERFWLEYYDVENNSEFLNLTNKPFGNSGLSPITRNKISKSHQGKVIPDSVRKKMSKSRKISNVFENFLKKSYKKHVDHFFGENSRIEVRDIVFSPVKRTCLIDCIVYLGDEINETYMDEDYVRNIMYKIADKVLYDYKVNVMVRFDV